MSNPPKDEDVLAAAQNLLSERLEVIKVLTADTRAERHAQVALLDLAKATAQTYAEALRIGWSPEELKRLGFNEPTVKLPGRPRRVRGGKSSGSVSTVPAQPEAADTIAPAASEAATA
ncbi:hypothetical protein QMK19_28970 [Streptomyces sp. H10-C2]|uniref:hypothetical protein n=1 Tax=unclassified Streptomyces TaxID=2593676 RepID=UPI0024B8890D|nr:MULTISPECIES: hypothetical protein [unclassified Streptomyces]MDJ0344243.1 hypothetical protein [Streptomyces sp. PH10-H1]MDJ0373581.1 hypothetical protein [Streptomyces sp. H10-C2]